MTATHLLQQENHWKRKKKVYEIYACFQESEVILGDEMLDFKSLSPDPLIRRSTTKYRHVRQEELPKGIDERLEKLYPFVNHAVRAVCVAAISCTKGSYKIIHV